MKRLLVVLMLLSFCAAGWAQERIERKASQGVRVSHGEFRPGPPMPSAPLGKWWKNSEIAKELQLTDPQIQQIEKTFLDYRLKLIDLKADVERQEIKLQPLIEADRPDEQQVGTQIDAVLAARGKLEKTNTLMMLAIRKVLSVEQWKKLQAIQQKREGPFAMHFDMPVPPGPGMERDHVYFFKRRVPGEPGPETMPLPPPPNE